MLKNALENVGFFTFKFLLHPNVAPSYFAELMQVVSPIIYTNDVRDNTINNVVCPFMQCSKVF